MSLPYIKPIQSKRQAITKFAGMNTTAGAGINEFADLMNMTNEDSPALSVRKPLELLAAVDGVQSVIAVQDEVYYIRQNGTAYDFCKVGLDAPLNGEENLDIRSPQLTQFGAYIIIGDIGNKLDDSYLGSQEKGFAYNVRTKTFESINAKVRPSGQSSDPSQRLQLRMCREDGTTVANYMAQATAPPSPQDGWYWYDTTNDSLKQYSSARSGWVSDVMVYVKLFVGSGNTPTDGAFGLLNVNDGIQLSGFTNCGNIPEYNTIHLKGDNSEYIVITGLLSQVETSISSWEIKRQAPQLDFMFGHEGRMWGCNSQTHEIFASSSLGFNNFNVYDGQAYDGWASTIASDGDFTGACSYGGYPYFFKKDKIYKIYGSLPSDFSLQEINAPGGEAGTIAEVNGVLYYKADRGIYAFTGSSFPTLVSRAIPDAEFGNCAAVHGDKYMIFSDQNKPAYVYDTIKGTWTKYDTHGIVGASTSGGDTYLASVDGILSFSNSGSEYSYDWHLETAIIGTDAPDDKQISQVRIRFKADKGAHFDVYFRYDGIGGWEKRYTHDGGTNLKSVEVPIRPRRCDYFQMRIKGEGGFSLQSIAYNVR